MKRFRNVLLRILTVICALSLLGSCALADACTIDEALQLVGTDAGRANGGRLELTGDFSMYDPLNPGTFVSDGGKIVILWREDAPREYTESSEAFSTDYDGVMAGSPVVYLCADLMERLPEEARAASLEEAAVVIIAETNYEFSATAITYLGDDSGNVPSMAELENILNQEESAESELPSEITEEEAPSHSYHPMFDCWMYVTVYDAETLGCSYWDSTYFPFKELRANPEADDLWQCMVSLVDIMQAAMNEDAEARFYDLFSLLLSMDTTYLTDEETEVLVDLLLEDDAGTMITFCWEKFWELAGKLKSLDSRYSEMYDEAIAKQSIEALAYIVNTRDFSSFDRSDILIRLNREHLGTPDLDQLESMLQEAFTGFETEYGWDMALVSEVLNEY